MPDVDVIVTAQGSRETAFAVHEAGGLVGMRSSSTRPAADVPIDFVDWPFMLEDPSIERHVDVVREEEPTYAVAPDVEPPHDLEKVLEVAAELDRHAETVIVVPKSVDVAAVPERFRVGAPFRDEFDTDTGVNTYFDFQGRPVHVLGGNPTDHFALADRFELDVASLDTPNVLAWADNVRVWVGRRRGATEVGDLVDAGVLDDGALEHFGPVTSVELAHSRSARIMFTVRNLIAAWNDPRRAVELPRQIEPGRGPPPPARDPGEEGFEEELEQFRRGVETAEVGRVEREAPAERAQAGFDRFGETATGQREEGGDMADEEQENKRRRWQLLQEEADEEVTDLGLGEGAIPDRDDKDEG